MQNEHLPTDRRKLSPLKIASYAGFAVGAIVLVCALALLLFADPLVNRFVKPRITKAFAEMYPAYSIRIADMNYSVLKNRFRIDSVALSAVDSTFSSNMGSFSVSGIGWMHLLWGGSLAPDDFATSVVDAQNIVLNFPQEQYEFRCQLLRVSVPDSEIVVEAFKLGPLGDDEQFSEESKFRQTRFRAVVPHAKVMGLACLELLQGKNYRTHDFANSVVEAQDIVLNFPQEQYELRCGLLHISVPDSEMVADSIKYYSLMDDEQFFVKSQFRQTRFRFDIPQMNIMGLDCLALLHGNIYDARSITLHDVFADILVNMDKRYDKNSSNPQMPNEALSSMKEKVKVDSLKIINGRFKYSERYAVKAIPGVITFDKVNVSVSGIANHPAHPETAVVHGEGLFMNSGTMKLSMVIPLTSKDFSLRYSGSLSTMAVTELNSFIEAGEHQRIKSGILHSAMFNINVNSGHASGTLRLAYKDLSIAILNKDTGSENGIFDQISTLIGKIFVIRRTNMPDEKGLMKIGTIKYTRNRADYFLQFLWFALRNSVADVVGFPPIPSE